MRIVLLLLVVLVALCNISSALLSALRNCQLLPAVALPFSVAFELLPAVALPFLVAFAYHPLNQRRRLKN